jgi:hypothetical protein
MRLHWGITSISVDRPALSNVFAFSFLLRRCTSLGHDFGMVSVVLDEPAGHRLGTVRGLQVAFGRGDDGALHQDVPEQLLAIFDVFHDWFQSRDGFEGCSFINVLLEMGAAHPAVTPVSPIWTTSARWWRRAANTHHESRLRRASRRTIAHRTSISLT